jgi:hypothetical protein
MICRDIEVVGYRENRARRCFRVESNHTAEVVRIMSLIDVDHVRLYEIVHIHFSIICRLPGGFLTGISSEQAALRPP